MQPLVEKYIQLRDLKKKLKGDFDKKTEKLTAVMDKIEGVILKQFNEQGITNVKTPAGTAYKATRASAKVADWDATLDFIRDNDLWTMLERRVSNDAVKEYKEANGDLPPGLDWQEEVVINIRRS